MKSSMILLTVLLPIWAGCAKQLENTDGNPESSITVYMPEDTKVAIGQKTSGVYPLTWETGDKLVINYTDETQALESKYNGQKYALFKTTEKLMYPLTLVYPAAVRGGAGYILIPEDQTFLQGRLAGGCGVMTAVVSGKDKDVRMNHVCGYVRIPVTGSAKLTSATLSATSGEFLAGRFSVSGDGKSISFVQSPSTAVESSSRINMSMNCTLSGTQTVIYFAVPVGTYSKGFKLTLRDSNGKSMTKTMYATGGKTIQAGIVTEMPALSYVPGTPESEVFEVSSSKIEFAAMNYTPASSSIMAANEDVMVTASGLNWATYDIPSVIPAGRTVKFSPMPTGSNPSEKREGVLTLTGATSGTVKTISVSQKNLYKAVYGFPALWEISGTATYITSGKPNDKGNLWLEEGIATAQMGNGAGNAYISTGSTSGRKLNYSLDASSSTKTLCVGGMGEGDYILFSVPVVSVPAGTDFDFMLTLNANSTAAPKYFIFEYWDGNAWKCDESRLYTASENSNIKYSFYIKHFSSANHRTFIQSFTLANAVNNDFVRMRIRVVGNIDGSGGTLKPNASALVYLCTSTYQACNIVCYKDAPAIKDHTKLMQLGNSFTYYFGSAFKLKEMCRRGGHQTEVHINLKGSQEFEHHLDNLVFSQEVVKEGGYDKAIIQDGSYFHAEYGIGSASAIKGVTVKYSPSEILALTKRMTKEIKKYSPGAQIILESVWSYSRKAAGDNYLGFGSFENFDKYQWKGSTEIAAACTDINWLSPIGKAFANARSNYGFTSSYNYLNHTDNYHDAREGAYLKSCINYLILFGDDFDENAPDCDLPAATAAKLRQAARDIVIGKRESFHIR